MTTMDLSTHMTPLLARNCSKMETRVIRAGSREHEEEGFLDERSQEHA
jgi:hypothetical protein